MENVKAKQMNVNLYTRYKTFSWDVLFYYSIIFLFFTQTKGINSADVLLAEAFYPLFKIIFLVPATILINSVGKRKSLIIGNSFVCLSIFIYIISFNFTFIVIGQLFSAIGFIIKGVCESNILYDSLEKNEKRGAIFANIEGKGTSYYYYIDAFSAVISGFLFSINGYIPMILCFAMTILSIYLSIQFKEIDEKKKIYKHQFTKEFKDLWNSFKLFNKSRRLKNLIFFGALLSGIILSVTMLRSSIMQDIGIPAEYFGIIFAIMGIISGISAKNEYRFHRKFKNRTLASLAIPFIFSFIVLGLICNLNISYEVNFATVIFVFLVQYIARGPFYPLIKRYLNNFTNTSLRTKISSSFNFFENILRFLITFLASNLLRVTTTANTFIILGCILGIIIVLMLDNMRKKVGLRPEQYSDRDIKIIE